MIRKSFFVLSFCFFFTVSTSVFADEHVTKVGEGDTYITVDEQNEAIIFVINGQKKALLDEEGLHIREYINYGRNIKDYGPSGFDAHIQAMEARRLTKGDADHE